MEHPLDVIGQYAEQALLYEVSCYPKPGLVDPLDSGSHNDMNIYTFLASSVALRPYLDEFVATGEKTNRLSVEDVFQEIRRIGLVAEEKMLTATQQVNTHKGAIFTLGLLLTNYGRLSAEGDMPTLSSLQVSIQKMTAHLLDDFTHVKEKERTSLTWGERLYLDFGITGIRGEAHKGYPIIFDIGYPYFTSHDGTLQQKMLDTLLFISLRLEDTTLMKRSQVIGRNALYTEKINRFFELGGSGTSEGFAYLESLNQEFKQKHWSIGGSADMLVGILFLYLLVEANLLSEE